MALVFPSNPTTGQVYQSWQWDGTKWACVAGTSALTEVLTNSTLTGNGTSAAPLAVAGIDDGVF